MTPQGPQSVDQTSDKAIREKNETMLKIIVLAIVFIAAVLVISIWQRPIKENAWFNAWLSFLNSLLSTAVIAGAAAFVFKVSDVEYVLRELKNISAAFSMAKDKQCAVPRDLFEEVEQAVKLIHRDRHTSAVSDLNSSAAVDRNAATSSKYVLPLTLLTYKYFVSTDEGKKWFQDETRTRQPQRVVIVDDGLESDDRIRAFLRDYEHADWRILPRSALLGEDTRRFRNFCVFDFEEGKKAAYFTYLDRRHSNVFTKGSWAQYRTTNKSYIGHLEEHFDYLWKMDDSEPIRKWVATHDGRGVEY